MTHSSEKEVLEVYCEAPISERLYYQLTVHYIPTLVSCVDWYYPIKIVGELEHSQLESAECVGTGISGGVDSYYSLLKSLNEDSANYRVTHGLYCETLQDGEFNCELQKSLRKLSENICKEGGIEFVDIKSNICTELYSMVHEMTVTSMFLSYVFVLQKLFGIYYFSSSHTYQSFAFVNYSSEYHQLFNMYCLSTENTELYVTGADAIRYEKMNYISKYEAPKKYLMVCRNPILRNGEAVNCSRCAKCTRTMIDLELEGRLDEYKDIFDVEYFRKNPNYFYGYLFFKGKKDAFIRETLELAKRKKFLYQRELQVCLRL